MPALVVWLSRFMTFRPGDLVWTGTPGGVGEARTPQRFLRDGDVVETEIERHRHDAQPWSCERGPGHEGRDRTAIAASRTAAGSPARSSWRCCTPPPDVDAGVDGPTRRWCTSTMAPSRSGTRIPAASSCSSSAATPASAPRPTARWRWPTGTLVVCPADERHWHGAVPGGDTTLLAVTWGTTEWSRRPPE